MTTARTSSSLHASCSSASHFFTARHLRCIIRGPTSMHSSRQFWGHRRAPGGQRLLTCLATSNGEVAPGLAYGSLLLPILDENPYLSDGNKQAPATAAGLASKNGSRLTVLLVDKDSAGMDQNARIETISWHLKENGYDSEQAAFKEISLAAEETHNSSVVVGNAVDQIEADLVLLSTEAVHSKAVDANLLAEFVTCPVLLLP